MQSNTTHTAAEFHYLQHGSRLAAESTGKFLNFRAPLELQASNAHAVVQVQKETQMMNGIDLPWVWAGGLLILVIGLGVGFFANHRFSGHARKLRLLDQELEAAKSAHQNYRSEVNQHFEKSSELLQEMTRQYRAVYDHLAGGAHALGDGHWQSPLLNLEDAGKEALSTPELPGDESGDESGDKTRVAAKQASSEMTEEIESEIPSIAELDLLRESAVKPEEKELH